MLFAQYFGWNGMNESENHQLIHPIGVLTFNFAQFYRQTVHHNITELEQSFVSLKSMCLFEELGSTIPPKTSHARACFPQQK
jgi:hypothetical protein